MFKKRALNDTIILERTGALTSNQLIVESVWQPRRAASSISDIISRTITTSNDPLDHALTAYMQSHGGTLGREPLHQFSYAPEQGMSGNIWHHGAEYIVAIKGAPEQVIAYCELSDNERESIMVQLHVLSADGSQVLAIARAVTLKPFKQLTDLTSKTQLQFIGFISLSLKVPSTTRQLLTTVQSQGTSIYVLTGQHPLASYSTNLQLGLATQPRDVLDADTLDVQSDDKVKSLLQTNRIIAHADQVQKARLIKLIKSIHPGALTIDSLEDLERVTVK